MPVGGYLNPKDMTLEQYEEVHCRLKATGGDDPPERLHHSCFGFQGNLMIYEV